MSSSSPSMPLSPTPEGQKVDQEYSQDFETEEKSELLDLSNAFSVSEESELKEIDSDDVVLSVMSTIDEEPEHSSSKGDKSNPESRVPDELKGLQHYFEEGLDDEEKSSSKRESKDLDTSTDDQSGLEEILAKLERLTNAQMLLENVLDADSNMKQEDVEEALKQALSQLPTNTKNLTGNENDSQASLSLSREMEALQKLIDAETNSVMDEKEKVPNNERKFDEVFQELERTISERDEGGSCDEQDSILNESYAASLPQQLPWENFTQTATPTLKFLSQPNSKSSRSNSLSEDVHAGKGNNKKLKLDQQVDLDLSHTLLDPSQFEMDSSISRTRTKTIRKNMIPSGKSASVSNLRPNTSTTIVKESQSTHSILQRPQSSPAKRAITTISSGPSPSHQRKSNTQEGYSSPGAAYLGAGEGRRLSTNSIIQKELDLEEKNEKISKLEAELKRQESLLDAYQEDNQKLYKQLKTKETEQTQKEGEWEELVNSLKTEIATMKIQRLAPLTGSPSRPSSASNAASKQEVEKLTMESAHKSQQILELRKEVISLRNQIATESTKGTPTKKSFAFQEREKELQKEIRGLNKQVRTLQKILYSKDGGAAKDDLIHSSQDCLASPLKGQGTKHKEPQVQVLEFRIAELERNLVQADADAKERLKDFQARLNALKNKYDDQMKEYELQLQESTSKIQYLESSAAQDAVSELQCKIDRGQSEVNFLKQEINRYKREQEISQKSSVPNQTVAKNDAGTLSLAIKSFKSELADKEKDVIKLKKEIADLNRTNVSLKKERERYLMFNTGHGNPQRIVTRVQTATPMMKGKNLKDASNTKLLGSPNKVPVPNNNPTVEILRSSLQYEREEFDQMLSNKKKELEERDKIIKKLRKELDELSSREEPEDIYESENKSRLLEELRSRVSTQNELILKLKEHISHYRQMEMNYQKLVQENKDASTQIQDLRQRLDIAKTLARPESEILSLLGQKFDELNSRYLQREQQMETLLNRLSVQTSPGSSRILQQGGGSSSGQLYSSTYSSSSPDELDLRQLSPSLSSHLFANLHKHHSP